MPNILQLLAFGFLVSVSTVFAIKINFGNCPFYNQEPCDSNLFKVTLSTGLTKQIDINITNPEIPSFYNPKRPTKILIHGYGGLTIDTATRNVTYAYRLVGNNVFEVDWSYLSNIPCYPTATVNVWYAAQCIGEMLMRLDRSGTVRTDKLHLIGFSLGAHVAGIVGQHVKKSSNQRMAIKRITGLDPALPFFTKWIDNWKLDASDATFVDIIHTSAGFFGKLEATGHVDFYVNGGSTQPFCETAKYPPLCSHGMAGVYFGETIVSDRSMIGIECLNTFYNFIVTNCTGRNRALLGENTDFGARGIFSVETANQPPFNTLIKRKSTN